MNFLQPLMLFAIPLVGLPIVIHLINQRRYQTMRWGAMHFLLEAKRMSRGYARIRRWLILACRTLAIAGIILAACRPLASDMLGLVGGMRANTTIVLLDRSPSMSQTGDQSAMTKREASLKQIVSTLQKWPSDHWILIESERITPLEIDAIEALLDMPETGASSTTADIPAMLAAAADYVDHNKTGRIDIWLCSDLRANDWQLRSGQWQALRERFLAFPQTIRLRLCGFAEPAPENVAVEIVDIERLAGENGSELSVSVKLRRDKATSEPVAVPVWFDMGAARSQVQVELVGKETNLQGHRIPIDSEIKRGWGKISLAPDKNTADNEFYFVFDEPVPRNSVLVMEDMDQAAALKLASEVPPNGSVECQAELIEPHQLDAIAWEKTALVLWQAPLPQAEASELIDDFVDRGGQVIFFPPQTPQRTAHGEREQYRGVSWGDWKQTNRPTVVSNWKMDQDLLANSLSGISLPVGEIQTMRHCPPRGELTGVATLDGGDTLLARLPTSAGGIYFCSTTTSPTDSTLASNGAVLYVAIQRALANGARVLGKARRAIAGKLPHVDLVNWQQLDGADTTISTSYAYQAGVYQHDDLLVAINRDVEETQAAYLSEAQVHGLFSGLDFGLVQNEIGTTSSLVQEIWRALLVAMIVALLLEAVLCVPPKPKPLVNNNSNFWERAEREAVLAAMQGAA